MLVLALFRLRSKPIERLAESRADAACYSATVMTLAGAIWVLLLVFGLPMLIGATLGWFVGEAILAVDRALGGE